MTSLPNKLLERVAELDDPAVYLDPHEGIDPDIHNFMRVMQHEVPRGKMVLPSGLVADQTPAPIAASAADEAIRKSRLMARLDEKGRKPVAAPPSTGSRPVVRGTYHPGSPS